MLVADKTRYYYIHHYHYSHIFTYAMHVFIFMYISCDSTFELTGNGDVLEPEVGVMGVGSGGTYALAAALVSFCLLYIFPYSHIVAETFPLL